VTALSSIAPSRRRLRWFSFVSVLVLVAGVVAALVVFLGNTGTKLKTNVTNQPAKVVKHEKNLALDRQARRVAGRFIETAVARHDLAASWPLAGSELKSGLTKKDWLTGNIPVIPFTAKIDQVRMKVDLSEPGHALLEVLLLPTAGTVKPAFFFIELRKESGQWRVVSWVPRSNIAVPSSLSD
jgi:hypothetical protein